MRRPFSKIENSLEFIVERPFAMVFRRSIQPAEVGKRLRKELTSGQIVSVRGRVAPNSFTVLLNPDDIGPYLDHGRLLSNDLETWLDELSSANEINTLGEFRVRFEADPEMRRGRFEIRSSIQEPDDMPVLFENPGSTEPFEFVDRNQTHTGGYLEICSGPTTGAVFPIRKQSISVGRDLGNDLVIENPQVSRFHAEFELIANGALVNDRASLNGTFVNGVRVYGSQTIQSGDQIVFGTTICRFWSELL